MTQYGHCDICQLDGKPDIRVDEDLPLIGSWRGFRCPMVCALCREMRELPTKCPACRHPRHRMRCTVPCKWWIRWLVRGRETCDCEYWDARWMEVA